MNGAPKRVAPRPGTGFLQLAARDAAIAAATRARGSSPKADR